MGLEVLGTILRAEERVSEILLNADMNPLERMVKFFEAGVFFDGWKTPVKRCIIRKIHQGFLT